MNTLESKIEYYIEKRTKSGMSIASIRSELKDKSSFSDEEISKICRAVSDYELAQLNSKNNTFSGFFEGIYISYFLVLAFLILFIFSIYSIQNLENHIVEGKVDASLKLWRYFLLFGSLLFLARNSLRVINHYKRKE